MLILGMNSLLFLELVNNAETMTDSTEVSILLLSIIPTIDEIFFSHHLQYVFPASFAWFSINK